MAATYVEITRDEFEDWLFELCPVFERDSGTAGLYFCPLSRHVAVKISTTLGHNDRVVRNGGGRCRMSFVSRSDKRELRKDHRATRPSMTRRNRTQGWRENWATALRDMFATFKQDREHYNKRGAQTQDEYAAEWRPRIESVADWSGIDILRDLHDTLGQGYWLTSRQEQAIQNFMNPRRKSGRGGRKGGRKPKASSRVPAPDPGKPDEALIKALAELAEAATRAGDSWTVKFAEGNVRRRAERGVEPSPKQAQILRDKFTKHGLAVPAAVAA